MNFYCAEPTLTCTGTSTFNTLTMGYWNYRYRTCPAGYPLFSTITNLCYDVCDPYFYANTTSSSCLPCDPTCYTCSNTTSSTNCTSCNSTTDHRVLSGTTCVCMPGYYSTGNTICAACNYTCATCTNATGCLTCSGTNLRTLNSGQCPCNTNYTNNGTALCVACSTAITGCLTCTSTAVCTICNTAGGFTLSGSTCVCAVGFYASGSTCVACTLAGCQACTSATVCTTCNTAYFVLNGTICSCKTGTYLSGTTCLACTQTGCTNCTSASACTTCNATNKFVLSGSTCVCQTGYYLSGSTCLTCTTIFGCTACTSSTVCTVCNTTLHLTLSGSTCVCVNGYYNASGTCTACTTSISSCLSCTSATNCVSCSSPFIVSGGLCVCNTGYYASSSTTCTACSTAMVGCTSCTSSTSCTTCDAGTNFVISGSTCVCASGFYLSGSTCFACMIGCSSCSSSTACTVCNSTAHYILSGSTCVCNTAAGYIPNAGGCQSCSSLIAGCALCSSSTVCTTCLTGLSQTLILTATFGCDCPPLYTFDIALQDCVSCPSCCQYGAFYNSTSGLCEACNSLFTGCLSCTIASCGLCRSGYYLNGGACIGCSIITGCLSCSSGTTCLVCDVTGHFLLSGSSCVCAAGYALSGASCVPCSTTLAGCLLCTSQTSCISCDLSGQFITNPTNSSECICNPGYYLSGGVCLACTTTGMVGCIDCSSATVCTSCNSTGYYMLSGSTCSCINGYYSSGSSCASCGSLVGCLLCTSATTCTSCNSVELFQLVGSACTCIDGFYLSGNDCVPCPVGCTICDSTGTSCSSCDTAEGFVLSGSSCVCATGTYLPVGGIACSQCSAIYSMCLVCTASSCTSCQSPAIVSGSSCACPAGYYNDTLSCQTCSSHFLGCSQCTLATCTLCDTSLFYAATPNGGVCECATGYIMVGSSCVICSSLIVGCSVCSTSSICTICDSSLQFYMDSGHCLCSPTYFMNSTDNCQLCSTALIGCDTCVNSTNCTTCQVANQFVLLDNNTCGCAPTYVPSGTSCVSCFVSCVCYGYQWDSSSVCSPFCSDSITIYPAEGCDDGNTIDGDGCSSTCQEEINYTCLVDSTLKSRCSYNQPFNMTLLSTIKSPHSNFLTFNIALQPNFTNLSSLNFSELFNTNLPLGSPTFTYNNGILQLSYSFNQSVQGQNMSLTLNPGFSSFFFASPSSNINFTVDPTNNLPAVVYDDGTYNQFQQMDSVYRAAVYASYAVLIVGMACDKVIGVELFGVLQLAHLSTSDLNGVQPLLSPLMNMSMVHGINLNLTNSTLLLPNRVREIGYSQVLLSNLNIMLGLMVADVLIAAIIYCLGYMIPSIRSKTQVIAKHMLKEYLMMLVIFNSLNTAYSVGLQFTYLDSSNPYFVASIIGTVVSLLLPLAMVAAVVFSDKKEFGEFSSHYKEDIVSQGYFVATIAYRVLIGQTMSHYNEVEEATIVNVFYAVVFLLYLLSNTPYVKGYHNYRAIIVQMSGLIILCVTMFYRSMKSNTNPAEAYQILSPAMLEVVAIFTSLGVSAGCLCYELYLKVKSLFRKPAPVEKTPLDTHKNNATESISNPTLQSIPHEIPDDLDYLFMDP